VVLLGRHCWVLSTLGTPAPDTHEGNHSSRALNKATTARLREPYGGRMEDALREQLDRAREQYAAGAAGAVADAVRSCVAVVEGCTEASDPSLVAAAATLASA